MSIASPAQQTVLAATRPCLLHPTGDVLRLLSCVHIRQYQKLDGLAFYCRVTAGLLECGKHLGCGALVNAVPVRIRG